MNIEKESWGSTQTGESVIKFRLTNIYGNYIELTDYGATILSINIKDNKEELVNVCLGYNTIQEYEINKGYLGAIIGRVANRISRSKFTLNNVEYSLRANEGIHHLHGGIKGFDKCIWSYDIKDRRLIFSRVSKDGEENYPGNLRVEVSYEFTDKNELVIEYKAKSDKDTIVNLTNHAYFNLDGKSSNQLDNHRIQIYAKEYTQVDEERIPTGKLISVEGTDYDLRQLQSMDHHYDTNFVLGQTEKYRKAAYVYSKNSGITMEVYTNQPGIQFYTARSIYGEDAPQSGFCLETQKFPDAINHKDFPSIVLRRGESYYHIFKAQFNRSFLL